MNHTSLENAGNFLISCSVTIGIVNDNAEPNMWQHSFDVPHISKLYSKLSAVLQEYEPELQEQIADRFERDMDDIESIISDFQRRVEIREQLLIGEPGNVYYMGICDSDSDYAFMVVSMMLASPATTTAKLSEHYQVRDEIRKARHNQTA